MPVVIPVDEALAIVLRETAPLAAEEVPLGDALGRVLAEDVPADADLPPFDRAAMDGYALRAQDTTGASTATLEVIGELRAGEWPQRAVGAGQALRIMTGAPVPAGADAVQPVERTRALEGGRVEIAGEVGRGANVALRGCEVRGGETMLARGRRLDPSALAVLAAVGRVRPRVARRPLLSILVTGDEVVDAAATPARGQVRNSNGPALAAQARLAGAEVRLLGVAGDRMDAIASALAAGDDSDVLVVSGGVSAGDYDLVEPVLLEAGAVFFFIAVAIKPGAPLVFGRRGKTLVFGLPGNPVSAQVTCELFVRPCLLRLQGAPALARPRAQVVLLEAVHNRSRRTSHLPALVRAREGRLLARPLRSLGSGDLVTHAKANALVVMDAARQHAAAGESAPALLLDAFLEDDGAPL
jgi:molybdopterin molybdotransferase